MRYGWSSLAQSQRYSTPASASKAGVRVDSLCSGLSHPFGLIPAAPPTASSAERMDVRAFSGFRHRGRDGTALTDTVGNDLPAATHAFGHELRVAFGGERIDGRRRTNRMR